MRRSRCNRLPALSRPFPAQGAVPAFIDSALVPPRAAMTGMAAIRQLAEDFRQGGQPDREYLKTLGWTAAQLDEHAEPARIRAQALAGATV